MTTSACRAALRRRRAVRARDNPGAVAATMTVPECFAAVEHGRAGARPSRGRRGKLVADLSIDAEHVSDPDLRDTLMAAERAGAAPSVAATWPRA